MEIDPLSGVTVFVTAARARTFTQVALQTLSEVHDHRCIVGTLQGPPLVWWVNGGTTEQDEQRFTPPATHRLSDGEAMVSAAVGGLGLTQLLVSLVRGQINDGRLIQVLPSCSGKGVDVHARGHVRPTSIHACAT